MKMNRRDDVGGSAAVWLIPLVFGATGACVTMVPILVRERTDLPAYASVPLNVIGFFAMPGVFLSLVLTGSAHDPKLPLATVLNAGLYAGLLAWVRAYRKRKRQRPTAA
jgi:hypothetical protein